MFGIYKSCRYTLSIQTVYIGLCCLHIHSLHTWITLSAKAIYALPYASSIQTAYIYRQHMSPVWAGVLYCQNLFVLIWLNSHPTFQGKKFWTYDTSVQVPFSAMHNKLCHICEDIIIAMFRLLIPSLTSLCNRLWKKSVHTCAYLGKGHICGWVCRGMGPYCPSVALSIHNHQILSVLLQLDDCANLPQLWFHLYLVM